ncbi:MAG: hypothetical protein Q9196_003394 [Gyalolechia fulgens]
MATAMSKRTQVRNEKALQELVRTVPGNNICADCEARNPGWASWSLGIFLCMRCASLHRKLGTHISKVKSLSMDRWTNEQVDCMRRNGNTASNRIYNPRNLKPTIPLDVDEVEATLERFIRQKYDQQSFSGADVVRPAARQDTGSTRSSDDQPPPLPPKPGKRFGFGLRSASSALPLSRHAHISPPTSPEIANGYPRSPPIRVNKQSRVFGASVGGGGENMESKLTTLRDMGFMDDKRNSAILKGLNGNLERAIEALVRLGDGSTPGSRPRSPVKPGTAAVSQQFSRVGVEPPQAVNGVSITQAGSLAAKVQEAPLPQIPPNQVDYDATPSISQSHNPFDTSNMHSDTWPLETAFESMQVSQPQPLFPNATGGYPMQPNHVATNRFQQSMTPPVSQLHQHVHSNPYAQQMPTTNNTFNPFLPQAPPIPSYLYPPDTQTQPNPSPYNPFAIANPTPQPYVTGNISPSRPNSVQPQIPEQQHVQMGNQNQPQPVYQQQPPPPPPPQMDPYALHQPFNYQPPSQYQQYPSPSQYQPQSLQPRPTGRFDKSSILALYNYPQLAPPPLPNAGFGSENQIPSTEAPISSAFGAAPKVSGQRSVTMPAQLVSGSRNPFLSGQRDTAGNGDMPNSLTPVATGSNSLKSALDKDFGDALPERFGFKRVPRLSKPIDSEQGYNGRSHVN